MSRIGWACEQCGDPAIELHHIIHLTEANCQDPFIAFGYDNLMALCNDCHNKVHARFGHAESKPMPLVDSQGHIIGQSDTTIDDILSDLII